LSNSLAILDSRVKKLERNNRVLTLFCVGFPFLAFLLGADVAEHVWKGKKVTAEEFVLINSNGEPLASLGVRDGGGAELKLADSEGRTRVLLTSDGTIKEGPNKNAPALILLSRNGKPALIAGTNSDSGFGSVDFLDDGEFKGGVGGRALHDK
jgi:hypothetical protein